MKKFFVILIAGLFLSLDSPAQGYFNSLNKAINGLSQQRNTQRNYSQRSYERRQSTTNYKLRDLNGKTIGEKSKEKSLHGDLNGENPLEKYKEKSLITQKQNSASEQLSNEKVITLVVGGTGRTKEEATKNALRSAIEQAFGTFVSANTEVLNDELIKDEITTVSTGNIRSYKELSITQTSNGLYDASVQATVSIDQLTKFAQSKGMQTELAGAAFIMNMKMRELNKKNELVAIKHMINKIEAIAEKGLFNYKLEIGEPRLENGSKYSIKLKVLFCENENTIAFYETIYKTLQALSLTEQEQQEYRNSGLNYYWYDAYFNYGGSTTPGGRDDVYALRNRYPVWEEWGTKSVIWFMPLIIEAALSYEIKDNIGNTFYCDNERIKIKGNRYYRYDYIAFNCIWDCYDRKTQTAFLWNLCPKDRLRIVDHGLGDSDGFQLRPTGGARFNPSVSRSGKRRTFEDNANTYYWQEFLIMYTEAELSKLNSIVINHK